MTQRDDMVFTPDIGEQRQPTARVRGVEERRMHQAKKKGGIIRRMRQLRRIRQRARRRAGRPGKTSATARRIASAGRRGATRLAARGGARALATPVGAVVGGLAVAALVALRLKSGRPIEGMAEDLNSAILGTTDDEARARQTTKQQLKSNSNLTSILGREHAAAIKEGKTSAPVNSQVARLAAEFTRLNTRDEIGRSIIRGAFPVNNTLDMLILRGRDAVVAGWKGEGGGDIDRSVAERIFEAVTGSPAWTPGGAKTGGR